MLGLSARVAYWCIVVYFVFILGPSQSRAFENNFESITFKIVQDGSNVGRHSVQFSKVGTDLHVDIAIDIDIRVLFIPIYSYRHRNKEIWRNGKLMSIQTHTDDNGEKHWVKGKYADNSFVINSSSGSFSAPSSIIPTSYWLQKITSQSLLLDTQHGKLLNVNINRLDDDILNLGNKRKIVHPFVISGDLNLTLWYSRTGEWVKTAFKVDNTAIEYFLENETINYDNKTND